MNRKNIKTLIAALEAGETTYGGKRLGFNMEDWMISGNKDRSGHNCKTTACLAGWTTTLFAPDRDVEHFYAAKDILDLSYSEAEKLFFARGAGVRRERITLPQAITTLKKLLRNGKVDWSHVK